MSYLLLCEAAERGEIGFSDEVTITAESELISRSADGMIAMTAGSSVPMQELIEAMLLASSNEAAASLAAHTAGSTEAFVERMNARAQELGLYTAKFYTPHGLPVYTDSAVTAKLQNKMCALDMFRLCAYLLKNQGQITAITAASTVSRPAAPTARATASRSPCPSPAAARRITSCSCCSAPRRRSCAARPRRSCCAGRRIITPDTISVPRHNAPKRGEAP